MDFRPKISVVISIISTLVVAIACKHSPITPPTSDCALESTAYSPTPYTIKKPDHFPQVPIPATNPMTSEGVQLGRYLFYDPILSADSTMSCSSCHLISGSFTDNKAVSVGIDGIPGRRSSMSLLNIGYATSGLFWDGRAKTLEDQALLPVEDPIEMHETWTNVIEKLKRHPQYPVLFRKAFGICDPDEITKELAAKALAQFERIIISSGESTFDKVLITNDLSLFDDDELDGYAMFFERSVDLGLQLPDAQCWHCHGNTTMTGNEYHNNGLDFVNSLDEFTDFGRYDVTGQQFDKGKFRTPTLRNIALSAPYMHDGRFTTLEEVVANYSKNGKGVSNESPLISTL